MATDKERIAALETHRFWQWGALVGVFGWCCWLSTSIIGIKLDIQGVKQKLADGGTGAIVAAIKSPSSPQQLAANLALISSTVRLDRLDGKKPDPGKLTKISAVVREAVIQHPDVPEGWQASSELVSYRSQAQTAGPIGDLPNCLDTVIPGANYDTIPAGAGRYKTPGFAESPPQSPWMAHSVLGHCVLYLDDDGHFDETSVGKFFTDVKRHHPNLLFLSLVLYNARIVYAGGKMLPVGQIQFTNCVFDLRPAPTVPPERGRSLTEQLLVANLDRGKIDLPSGI